MKYTFVILITFTLLSCKKSEWYNIKSDKSLAVPATLKDFQAMMDNAALFDRVCPSLGEVGSDGHFVTDAVYLQMSPASKNAYTWTHDFPYEGIFEWNLSGTSGVYPRVYYCNVVLEGLEKIKSVNADQQLQLRSVKGQALFHRAKSFYELSQIFAPPYNVATFNSDLGIPLRLESDFNIPSTRSTVKQAYDRIIGDLLFAKDLLPGNILPGNPLEKTRPSKVAAFAMLARAYLSIEDYSSAGIYADSCLQLYNTLIDYNSISTTATSSFPLFTQEVILHGVMGTQFQPVIKSNICIDLALYNMYSDNDLRKKIFFTKNNTTGLVAYKGSYGDSELFSGLATDEIYLIRAESYARAGKITAAMKDLNDLLAKRWDNKIPFPSLTASTSEAALTQILLERQKELLLRGLRWSDLRRLNNDSRFKITITRKIANQIYSLEPGSFRYTFPIPDDIIRLSGIQQNQGW